MKQFELPYFNNVDVENITEEQGYMSIDFKERQISLMWFAEEGLDEKYFLIAKDILSDLESFDKESLLFLRQEFGNDDDKTVVEYLEFHLEELADELAEITGESTPPAERIDKLLTAMKLNNIAFHDGVIVADYVLNKEISDQILAISIDANGEKSIAWES